MDTGLQFLIGIILAILVSLAAWRLEALDKSGAIAAAITGGLIFGLGGVRWAALLLTFFISSSALSRAFRGRKSSFTEKFAKGSRRDWGQVLANGGLGAVLAVLQALMPGQIWPWMAYVGAMAAVNADTWATEIGVLSRAAPRNILTWETAERGASGAVSWLGNLATLLGATLVAGIAALFSGGSALAVLLVGIVGGLFGSLIDSGLGATIQVIYWCPACEKETERNPLHLCGTPTEPLRGLAFFNNDVVNFACSLAGALAALFVMVFLQ